MDENIEIYTKVNGKGYYIIEDRVRNKWIKLKPDFAGSGVHIMFPDKREHHFDFYDASGNKINGRIDLVGYSDPGHLYLKSGANKWELDINCEPHIIPTFPGEIKTIPSGSAWHVHSSAPGWCIVIVRE